MGILFPKSIRIRIKITSHSTNPSELHAWLTLARVYSFHIYMLGLISFLSGHFFQYWSELLEKLRVTNLEKTHTVLWGSLSAGNTLINHFDQVGVFQRGCHAFLIGQLLVNWVLGGVCPRGNFYGDFEARRQTAQQLHPDGQTDQRRHTAMGYRWCVRNMNNALLVVDGYETVFHDVQLFQTQRMLRIVYVTY